ncbi:hypothetical protein EMCRGX_G024529 [Ephydatia muelleri]
MALLIISPYIGEGERKVLLALSKVFHIAYCDFFDPTEANAWQQICIDFVYSNYGSSSTFSAELNKQAPSRDNANHFAIVEHLHYICAAKAFKTFTAQTRQLPTMVHSMHSRSIVLQRMELEQQDPPFGVIVHMGVMDGDIHQYRAVVSQSSELVHSGDYVKLHPSFCQFRATIKPKSEHTLCLVQGFETFKLSNGTAMLEQR